MFTTSSPIILIGLKVGDVQKNFARFARDFPSYFQFCSAALDVAPSSIPLTRPVHQLLNLHSCTAPRNRSPVVRAPVTLCPRFHGLFVTPLAVSKLFAFSKLKGGGHFAHGGKEANCRGNAKFYGVIF